MGWVGKKVEHIQLVADVLNTGLFADETPRSPVTINETPHAVYIHGVPRMLTLAARKTHPRSIFGALGITRNDIAVQLCVSEMKLRIKDALINTHEIL